MLSLELDYPVIITLIGALILGISSGVLSCYAVLRQQSLLGDAISHAALPGLCIAFLLTLSKSPLYLLSGALIAGWLGTMFILLITRQTLIKEDTALGIVLSVFFGVGILLLTMIQKIPSARQSGLETYLFGSAASILKADLYIMGGCLVVIICLVLLCWKEFKCLTFDYNYLFSLGFPVKRLEVLLTSLLVITIVIGLQTVGVILMSALIIAPGTAARQWTDQLGKMVIISAFISVFSGVIGVLLSSTISHLPTGPTIVVVISICVTFSLFFAPKRGLIISWTRHFWNRKQLHKNTILTNFLLLARSHDDMTHPHDIEALTVVGGKPTLSSLQKLEQQQLVKSYSNNAWGLTQKGVLLAQKIHSKEDQS